MLLICLPKITSNFHNTLFLGAAHFARNIPDIHIVLYIHRCMHFKCEQMCFRFVLIFSLGTCWRLATTTHCFVCGGDGVCACAFVPLGIYAYGCTYAIHWYTLRDYSHHANIFGLLRHCKDMPFMYAWFR